MLGVPKDADLKQIKQAFKKKALKLHPDVNTAVCRTLCIQWLDEACAKPCLQAGCANPVFMDDEDAFHCSRMQRSDSWNASMHIRPSQTQSREAAMTENRCCLIIPACLQTLHLQSSSQDCAMAVVSLLVLHPTSSQVVAQPPEAERHGETYSGGCALRSARDEQAADWPPVALQAFLVLCSHWKGTLTLPMPCREVAWIAIMQKAVVQRSLQAAKNALDGPGECLGSRFSTYVMVAPIFLCICRKEAVAWAASIGMMW